MPRYYFDVHDKFNTFDHEGLELADDAAARSHAISALPRIAADEIGDDGDRRQFTMLVTDDGGRPVYSAALTFTGVWLRR